LRIAGAATPTPTSKADWSVVNTTVEWNGANQTVLNPTGLSGNNGYYNLILSGSGTKTMPATALPVNGDFEVSGSAQVTAGSAITIDGNFTIGVGPTFNTGNFDHTVGGNLDNSGTLTVASGNKITMNGSAAQSIFSNSPINFHDLTINNSLGVQLYADINVDNDLNLIAGNFNIGSDTLGINGTLTKGNGFLEVSNESSLSFGGSTLITLPDNLFSAVPTINNL
jgi:hypothetical protein